MKVMTYWEKSVAYGVGRRSGRSTDWASATMGKSAVLGLQRHNRLNVRFGTCRKVLPANADQPEKRYIVRMSSVWRLHER